MADELQQAPVEQDDPSLSSAVDSMPDIEALERGQAVDRASDGKFASRETPKQPEQDAKPAVEEKAAPAKAAPVEEPEDGEGTTHTLTPKLKGQLKAIANATDDHDSFMEQAFAELTLDDDAEAAVADEDFYNSLKAG